MAANRAREKSVLSRQDIASRRKAIQEKKLKTTPTGRRAIVGVGLLTVSVLALLSVATFDAHDRVGPGFHNAIGPVGHALAETLRGLFGFCAYLLPLAGLYATGILFSAEKGKRRWPQVLCLGLLLVSGAVLCELMVKPEGLPHAPGGLIGEEVAGLLTGLFSTVGTVVLVAALASVALIVGTQLAFLRFITFAGELGQSLARKVKALALALWALQKERWAERQERLKKEAEEEAAFLAELDEEEARLAELEEAASEAEEIAEENARLLKEELEEKRKKLLGEKDAALQEKETVLRAKVADREAKVLEREALRVEREALRAAREVAKERERLEKEQARGPVPMLAAPQPSAPPASLVPALPVAGDEPAWAMSLAPAPLPADGAPARPYQPSQPPAPAQVSAPPPRRAPNVVLPPGMPPPPPLEAFQSLPPTPVEAVTDSMLVAAETLAAGAALVEAGAAVAPAAPGAAALAAGAALAPAVPLAPAVAQALGRTPIIVEPKAPPKPTRRKDQEQFEFVGDRKSFVVPPIDLLEANQRARTVLDKEAFLTTADKLCAKLRDFGIEGDVVEIRPGPVVTMYEFKPAPGIKISKIASLADDLAMAMEAMRVRIVAPIPGKGVVGIEVPNKDRETVFLKEIAEQDAFTKSTSRLTMCLGKDIEGMPYVLDLAKAPHLLIAGTTGSGKSVSVNSMIMSVLLKSTPEEVRFIMVDPKMLELSVYEGIPHLLLPVVTDPRKAALALQWAVDEMTRRYKLLAEAGVRNIAGYNQLVDAEKKKTVAKRAEPATIDVTPSKVVDAPVIPSVAPPAAAEPPPVAEAAPAPAPSPADGGKKKKRKLFIVDMDAAADSPPPAPVAEPAPAPIELGVAAPGAAENPREELPPEPAPEPQLSPPVAAELASVAKEAEIRVDEQTAEEVAALELAAAAAADADAPAERSKLPYIVVIIDELADLMMVASKEVETSVARLAQMARAAGIHLMVATQRPSTDVVTGVIKANFPTRISFMLRSKPDSMTVLGTIGAEALLGMGDMLILPPTSAHLQRVHGAFVSEAEIKRVVDQLKAQGKPVYDENILKPREEEAPEGGEEDELSDELYDEAIRIVSEMRQVSISMLQRKMRIGYNRAARMIERMERDGAVGPADGAKPRDVLISPMSQAPAPGP